MLKQLYLSAFNNGHDSLTFDPENDDMSKALDPAWISHFGPEKPPTVSLVLSL
jgi:hypothetical protein